MTTRCYTELVRLRTFEDRFNYLKLNGRVGDATFGYGRYLNQVFYKSKEWLAIRDYVIVRDNGCDLGIDGRELSYETYTDRKGKLRRIGSIYIHHMNPLSIEDIENETANLKDPEFLICCSFDTHQAIHYGDKDLLLQDFVERKPNDTCPWKL